MEAKQTYLNAEHKRLGAKMVPFGGFEMPIQYDSLKEEAQAVRNTVGVFDVSHMGEFWLEGKDTYKFLDHLLPNDISGAQMGKAVYSPLCRENGTIIDDLIVYKLGPEKALVCVNASNIDKDWKWFKEKSQGFDFKLSNRSEDYSLLAVQGPDTVKVLTAMGILDGKDSQLEYYAVLEKKHQGDELILARTGYTGEDGFEIFSSHTKSQKIWSELLKHNVKPCGLGARDVLRIEVCYPLYGHEIHDEVTPLDSGLGWTVKMQKKDFIGKKALEGLKPEYKLVKMSLATGIPREGHAIEDESGKTVGKVTSGTFSVSCNRGVAMAHINIKDFAESNNYFINIRGKKYPAEIHKKPFVVGGHK